MKRWLCLAVLAACDGSPALPPDDVATAADTRDAETTTEVVDVVDAAPETVEDIAPEIVEDSAPETLVPPDTLVPSDVAPEIEVGPSPCDPPLDLTPREAWAPGRRLVTLVGDGGSGDYRFAFAENRSGATLNGDNGAYLSGELAGVDDVIVLTDRSCAGEARATVHVTEPLAILPAAAELAPGGAMQLGHRGGSGAVAFTLVASPSGASIDDGRYVAGPSDGVDRVRATDLVTSEEVEALITVRAGATLRLSPDHLFMPLGQRHRLATVGGSGLVDVVVEGAAASYADGWLSALATGEVTLTVDDRYTGTSASGRVTVVAAEPFPSIAAGDSSSYAAIEAPGDLNHDGWDDVVVALTEADETAWDSGAVAVFAGTPEGFAAEPVEVYSGVARADHFGRGLAIADLDGDTQPELLIGAYDNDKAGTNAGAVYIYPGAPEGFFAPDPSVVLDGRVAGDNLGFALAVCDFNGDGRVDIAAAARTAEDRTQTPIVSNAGGVHIYLGRADGTWGPLSDAAVWGRLPGAGGAFVGVADMQLGWDIAAGDFDGDGRCDLAAAGVNYGFVAGRTLDGALLVFRGRGPDALSPGGLDPQPWLSFVGNESDAPQSRFGYALASGDVDGDGLADVLVGQPYYNLGAQTQNGAVRLWRGKAFGAAPDTTVYGPDDLDWTWTGPGNESGDFFGWTVALGDASLIVGNLADEAPGGTSNTGTVHVIAARAGELPDPSVRRVVAGETNGQRFGVAAALVQDRDGDAVGELVVHAAFDSLLGPRVGRAFYVPSTAARAPLVLSPEPLAAGGEIGASAALLPTSDEPLVVSGGPRVQAGNTTARLRAGAVALGASVIDGYAGHASDDRLGDALATLDFDGDGFVDLAVVATSDDTGNLCSPARSNGGAVHVFRGDGTGQVATLPAFSYFGDQNGQALHSVAGADLDGDGKDELVIGSRGWDRPVPDATPVSNTGAAIVVRGRALGPSVMNVCAADAVFYAVAQDAALGASVTSLGDVDGDGCEDAAVGARTDDANANSSGAVWLMLGWGASCARVDAEVVRLTSFSGAAEVGVALDGGSDLDGDGLGELAVGGHQLRLDGNAVGGAWVVPGTWLASAAEVATPWLPGVQPPTLGLGPADSTRRLSLTGKDTGEQLGLQVRLLAPLDDRPGALVVARPFSHLAGVASAGFVAVHSFDPASGLDPVPRAGMSGETERPACELGSALATLITNGHSYIAVGARRASPHGVDDGGVWLLVDP